MNLKGYLARFKRKFAKEDLILFSKMMYQGMKGGLPVANCVRLSIPKNKKAFSAFGQKAVKELSSGIAFSEILDKNSDYFDTLFINLVKVGEQTGNLENVFRIYYEMEEKFLKLSNKILTIIKLPIIFFYFSFFVNHFVFFFKTSFFSAFASLIGDTIFHGIIWGILFLLYQKDSVRKSLHQSLIFTPVIGQMMIDYSNGIYFKMLNFLFSTGNISLMSIFEMAGSSVNNLYLRRRYEIVTEKIERRADIGEAFSYLDFVDDSYKQLIYTGEISGALDEAFLKISENYIFDFENKMHVMMGILGRLLLLVISASVAGSLGLIFLK